MNLGQSNNKLYSVSLDNKSILLNEIDKVEELKKLNDRYIITNICRNSHMKYEIIDNYCNVYYNSFSSSIYFNNNNRIKTIGSFIDVNLFRKEDEDRFNSFINRILVNKDINIPVNYFKTRVRKVINNIVKECKELREDVGFYIVKVINANRELVFMLISLNKC